MCLQGLDCINIFPLVQWLVKRALETRAEREAASRARAVREWEVAVAGRPLPRSAGLDRAAARLAVLEAPRRRYRPTAPWHGKQDAVRVNLALLEFREKGAAGSAGERGGEDGETELGIELGSEMAETRAKTKIDTVAFKNLVGGKGGQEVSAAAVEYEAR